MANRAGQSPTTERDLNHAARQNTTVANSLTPQPTTQAFEYRNYRHGLCVVLGLYWLEHGSDAPAFLTGKEVTMSTENIRKLMDDHFTASDTVRQAQREVRDIEARLIGNLFEQGDMQAFKINWPYVRRMVYERN